MQTRLRSQKIRTIQVSKEFNSQLTFNPKQFGFVDDETPAKPYFVFPEEKIER